jgi:hypothetical protein
MDFMSDNDTLSTHSTMSASSTSGLNSVGSALRTYVFRNLIPIKYPCCFFSLGVYIKQKIGLVEHFPLVQFHQKIV